MGANSVGQLREDLRRERQKREQAEERHKAALADLHQGASETERRLKERIAQLMRLNAELAKQAAEASRAADLRAELLRVKAEAAAMHGRLIVAQRALDEERRKPPKVVDRPVLTADARSRIAYLENEVSVLQSRLREIGE